MKFLVLLILVIGCGKTKYITGINPEPESFAGYHLLDGPSSANCVYIDERIDNVYDLTLECQSLVTTNPKNSSAGQFPPLNLKNLIPVEGKIKLTKDFTYTSGHDLEEDVSGSNITGKRRTDIVISLESGKLKIEIDVWKAANNSNLNEIVAKRLFKEL